MAAMELAVGTGKVHPAIGRIVYVIPDSRFGNIVGVEDNGKRFFVERKDRSTKEESRAGREEHEVWEAGQLLAT